MLLVRILKHARHLKKKRVTIPTGVIVGGAVVFLIVWYAFFPFRHKGATVDVYITKGESLHTLARELSAHKVITLSHALRLWVECAGGAKHIIPGHYVFFEYEGAASVARKLLNGRAVEIMVTIREGLTIEQTAVQFYTALHLDTLTFDSLCHNAEFTLEQGIAAPTLEGYLFPDTYRFPDKTTPDEAIKRMVERFKDATRDMPNATQGRFTFHEAVILGSIIEKEAQRPEERARISAVFHNRLRMHIPLGADPTVRYVFKKFSGPLLKEELKSPSLYNTRVNPGLPPGPICSPGLAAIEAALTPIASKELYFVAKWDGTGGHAFSSTNEEHNRKKLAIRRSLQEKKGVPDVVDTTVHNNIQQPILIR